MNDNDQQATRSVKSSDTVPQDILNEIVRRVVEVAHPERIILFGSAARGPMGPDSDLDLLVVKAGVPHDGAWRRPFIAVNHSNTVAAAVYPTCRR